MDGIRLYFKTEQFWNDIWTLKTIKKVFYHSALLGHSVWDNPLSIIYTMVFSLTLDDQKISFTALLTSAWFQWKLTHVNIMPTKRELGWQRSCYVGVCMCG
jgi:hypothetical protein